MKTRNNEKYEFSTQSTNRTYLSLLVSMYTLQNGHKLGANVQRFAGNQCHNALRVRRVAQQIEFRRRSCIMEKEK